MRSRWPVRLALALALGVSLQAKASYDTSYLMGLLQGTPDGGWVKISTNKYSDAWPTGSVASPHVPSGPESIIYSWSSFGWDSNNGYLTLFGGGHANYIGNEIYRVNATTGQWERGSLSSKTDLATWAVVDGQAPQSSHTWDNNLFLPINNQFLTFGGAVAGPGGPFFTLNGGGGQVPAGPWAWDPTKADPNKVGGSSGSGWDPATPGGNMWTNLVTMNTGGQPTRFGLGATAYVNENGKDVVYVSTEAVAGGFPNLYRYELGNIAQGGLATWQWVGVTRNSAMYEGTAAIDHINHLFVRTSFTGLAVWDLDNNNIASPTNNRDVAVTLVMPNGNALPMVDAGGNIDFGIAFNSLTGDFILWDGNQMWGTHPLLGSSGQILSTWNVVPLISSTATKPNGNYGGGVLGKWVYAPELGAFVVLDEWNSATQDAGVWLYRPFGWSASAVPDAGTAPTLLAGLLMVSWAVRRRRWH